MGGMAERQKGRKGTMSKNLLVELILQTPLTFLRSFGRREGDLRSYVLTL